MYLLIKLCPSVYFIIDLLFIYLLIFLFFVIYIIIYNKILGFFLCLIQMYILKTFTFITFVL